MWTPFVLMARSGGTWQYALAHRLLETAVWVDTQQLTDVGPVRFTESAYVETLWSHFYLVQDNSLIHTSSVVQAWFSNTRDYAVPHQPKESHLNPIEMWATMSRDFPQDLPRNRHIVVAKAITAWQ